MGEDKSVIKVSVRRLVEFLLRSGDITEGMEVRDVLGSMQAGSRIHRKLQRLGGADYHPEVSLAVSIGMGDYELCISGRADGIIFAEGEKRPDPGRAPHSAENETYNTDISSNDGEKRPDPGSTPLSPEKRSPNLSGYDFIKGFLPYLNHKGKTEIDEIKGTYRDLRFLNGPEPLHLAQAKCYGFIFLYANGLEETEITITYCNLDTEELKRFTESYTREELTTFFTGLVESYRRWSDFSYYFKRERIASIQGLKFPFPYRKGQFDLMAAVYRSIEQRGLLFMMAPTGTGKTLSSLYPSVMAMGQGLIERIFYLTAKTMTARNAISAIETLSKGGYRAKTVALTAKEKMCINEAVSCDPTRCPYAKGHFDRVNDALYQLLMEGDIFSREVIRRHGREREVCPYLLEYDLCDWCDNIIGDFNYVFDPKAYLKRFFASENDTEMVFLIDEAHNLPERGRRMYSASINTASISAAKKPLPKTYSKLRAKLSSLQRAIRDTLSGREDCFVARDLNILMPKALRLKAALDEFLSDSKNVYEGIESLRDFYFDLSFFLETYEEIDEDFVTWVKSVGRNIEITLLCIDPSKRLQRRLEVARSAVLFSATLLPFAYYRNLSCTVEDPFAIYAESSFDADNALVVAGGGVTSVYRARGEETYEGYAAYIRAVVSSKKGNYMVFVPSYAMLEQICSRISEETCDVIAQTPEMGEAERDGFLSQFTSEREKSLLAFCIAGGIFGEGVDLVGDALIGVIIAGVPLPQVSFEQKLLCDCFDQKYGEGFNYAYLYPAINKVLQSAGRLIRTETDRGVIVLLDERYRRPDYRALFPREWKKIKDVSLSDIAETLKSFWEKT